jgi:hypothetical protein
MSSPHPPIPGPQSAPGPAHSDDGPRTQSILLPPSQRQAASTGEIPLAEPPAQEAAVPESAAPAQAPTAGQYVPGAGSSLPPPSTGQFSRPDHPADPSRATGPMDFVPGFGERPAAGSSAAPPPVPGPSTTPGTPFNAPTTSQSPAGSSSGGPAPSARARRSPLAALPRGGRAGAALVSLGLGVLALVLLEIGLVREFGNQSLWDVVPTWSTFATVAVLLVLVPAVAGLTGKLSPRTAWRVGAGGLAALVVAWVLVALPLAASDRGFWLTTAVLAAGAALWLAPGRSE